MVVTLDTVRLSALLDRKTVEWIEGRKTGTSIEVMDCVSGEQVFTRRKGMADIVLPSHTQGVSWEVRDGELLVETSLPKLCRGHNVMELCDPAIGFAFLQDQLEEFFETKLPPVLGWEVHRLDVCEAYRFRGADGQLEAKKHLDSLKFKGLKGKEPVTYATSVTFVAPRRYSLKFYLKHDEFRKNSYQKLAKVNKELADELVEQSKGVLRIETTIHRQMLREYYAPSLKLNQRLTVSNVLNELERTGTVVGGLHQRLLDDLYREGSVFDSEKQVYDALLAFHGRKATAGRLLGIWRLYRDGGEAYVRSLLAPSTFRRYRKEIEDAGVALVFTGDKEKTPVTFRPGTSDSEHLRVNVDDADLSSTRLRPYMRVLQGGRFWKAN